MRLTRPSFGLSPMGLNFQLEHVLNYIPESPLNETDEKLLFTDCLVLPQSIESVFEIKTFLPNVQTIRFIFE